MTLEVLQENLLGLNFKRGIHLGLLVPLSQWGFNFTSWLLSFRPCLRPKASLAKMYST